MFITSWGTINLPKLKQFLLTVRIIAQLIFVLVWAHLNTLLSKSLLLNLTLNKQHDEQFRYTIFIQLTIIQHWHNSLWTWGHGWLWALEVHHLTLGESEPWPGAHPHVVGGVVPVEADVIHGPGPRPQPRHLSSSDLALQRTLWKYKHVNSVTTNQCSWPRSSLPSRPPPCRHWQWRSLLWLRSPSPRRGPACWCGSWCSPGARSASSRLPRSCSRHSWRWWPLSWSAVWTRRRRSTREWPHYTQGYRRGRRAHRQCRSYYYNLRWTQ